MSLVKQAKREEKRKRLGERNDRMRADYITLVKKGYRNDYIVDKLIKEYFLDACTIEAIVFKRGPYAEF